MKLEIFFFLIRVGLHHDNKFLKTMFLGYINGIDLKHLAIGYLYKPLSYEKSFFFTLTRI